MASYRNNKSENALWDGNKQTVTLVYDEDNDAIKMLRVNSDGELVVSTRPQEPVTVIDSDGDELTLSGETQNNKAHLFVNTDNVEDLLHDLIVEMRKINFQLAIMTDTSLQDEDVGDIL